MSYPAGYDMPSHPNLLGLCWAHRTGSAPGNRPSWPVSKQRRHQKSGLRHRLLARDLAGWIDLPDERGSRAEVLCALAGP